MTMKCVVDIHVCDDHVFLQEDEETWADFNWNTVKEWTHEDGAVKIVYEADEGESDNITFKSPDVSAASIVPPAALAASEVIALIRNHTTLAMQSGRRCRSLRVLFGLVWKYPGSWISRIGCLVPVAFTLQSGYFYACVERIMLERSWLLELKTGSQPFEIYISLVPVHSVDTHESWRLCGNLYVRRIRTFYPTWFDPPVQTGFKESAKWTLSCGLCVEPGACQAKLPGTLASHGPPRWLCHIKPIYPHTVGPRIRRLG